MNNYTNPVTVTGNPASFEASGNGKILSLSVPFSPIQDLHGYDSPWPAGGGKNKFITTLQTTSAYGTTFTVNADGSITVSGTPTQQARVIMRSGSFVDTSSVCIFSAGVSMPIGTRVFCSRNHEGAVTYPTISNTHTFTVGDTYYNMLLEINTNYDGNPFTLYPMIEDGSTATAWAPYSNICPISGRTGVSVYRTGVNVWDEQYYVSSNRIQSNYIPVLPNTTYNRVSPNNIIPFYYDADKNQLSTGTWGTGVFTTPADCYYLRFQVDPVYGVTYNHDISINYPSTDTDYHAYQGQTIAVDWTTEAGTVYGGTLDVVSGVLTVDTANIASYNGETITEPWISSMDAYVPGGTPTTGAQVVYTLATPITYQLTPTQIALILGQNNVWSDSNEAVTLTYVIELFTRYTFIVNGNDYTGRVERDSYRTAVTPVYGETVQTLDGVNHTALLRLRGSITVGLNPQTKANTAAICADLLQSPVEVQYHCLQRNANVTALMVADTISAQFLSRCLYGGASWNQLESITLKEL